MSDWFTLWSQIEKSIDFENQYPTPPSPPKKTFGNNISEEFLESRMSELKEFLEAILFQYNNFENVLARQDVERFLMLAHV